LLNLVYLDLLNLGHYILPTSTVSHRTDARERANHQIPDWASALGHATTTAAAVPTTAPATASVTAAAPAIIAAISTLAATAAATIAAATPAAILRLRVL
jgi:hypothetical protein